MLGAINQTELWNKTIFNFFKKKLFFSPRYSQQSTNRGPVHLSRHAKEIPSVLAPKPINFLFLSPVYKANLRAGVVAQQ